MEPAYIRYCQILKLKGFRYLEQIDSVCDYSIAALAESFTTGPKINYYKYGIEHFGPLLYIYEYEPRSIYIQDRKRKISFEEFFEQCSPYVKSEIVYNMDLFWGFG